MAAVKVAYRNGALIELLKERGDCLTSSPEKLPKIEAQIKKAIEDNKDLFKMPRCAFVTLTTQEARDRIAKWRFTTSDQCTEFKSLGEILTFDIEIVGVRAANAEELSHGHAHGPGGHHH